MGWRPVVAAVLVGAALVVGAGSAAGLPAGSPASGGDGTRRVTLGDSWAAGTAAGGVEAASGPCRRSTLAYAPLLARAAGDAAWTSRACAAAASTSDNGQFSSLDAGTEVITSTVGGDATGLGALAASCSSAGTPERCDAAAARFDRAVTVLPRALDAALADMRARAPRAAVTFVGYPLLTEGRACPQGAADPARAARVDDAVTRLDAVLADRVTAAGMRFVDVRPAFAGHGVCGEAPWLTSLTDGEALLAGGPTADGHALGVLPALAAAGPAPVPATAPATPGPAATVDGRGFADLEAPLFAG
ncbi:hypothetical protein GCM10023200_12120 [Actinomycetospora chlora]|uniref:SGNH hydrolase-type esterase domain-containing protein n=1 Tax=Actinomycetospora chlora TaxID=663608 RepID=A0ABP9AH56_9PSEU